MYIIKFFISKKNGSAHGYVYKGKLVFDSRKIKII